MPAYASQKDRYLTHLISAIDSLQHGERVTESVDRATFAVGMLHAVGMDDAAIGAGLRKEFSSGE